MSQRWLFVVMTVTVTLFMICYTLFTGPQSNTELPLSISNERNAMAHRMREKWRNAFSFDTFQKVDANLTLSYVYSAYRDDRPTPDTTSFRGNGSTSVVRVFAWFHQRQQSPLDIGRRWQCVFWNDKFEQINVVDVSSYTDTDFFDQKSEIVRAMLLCPYKSDKCTANSPSCLSPFAVSVVTSLSYQQPLNLLPVVDLSARRNHTSRSNVTSSDKHENKTELKSPTSLFSFAICVKPMHGKSITVDDLIQFIEVNRVFGAELFFFYIDDSVDSNVRHCIRNYERLGVVESTPWRLPQNLENRIPEKGQFLAMTECVYRLMYRTKYLIIQDIDELIVPTRTEDWRSMLALIDAESRYGSSDRLASYSFRNRFFLPDAPGVQPPAVEIPYNWSDRFPVLSKIIGETNLFPWNTRSKIMASPERILVWHTHLIVDHQVVPPGELNAHVLEIDAVMHHYRKKLYSKGPHMNYTRIWNFMRKVLAGVRNGLEISTSTF